MAQQLSLFAPPPAPLSKGEGPAGLLYRADLITQQEEAALMGQIAALPFAPFEFHGYLGHRRVVSFGWRYDFARATLHQVEPIPEFLNPLRKKVADVSGLAPEAFQQALVLEYPPGAGIGWHRDRPQFEHVAGVSLASPCSLRLRQRIDKGWARATLAAAPRSAYVLSGPARTDWEHSIPPVDALRYSVTFRTLR